MSEDNRVKPTLVKAKPKETPPKETPPDPAKPRLLPVPGNKAGVALTPAASDAISPQMWRRRILAISFVLCVIIPFTLGALYYAFIASDRYVAGAGFAVRSINGSGGVDLLGSFTGLANTGSTNSDSYILLKFLKSRDMVERLEKDMELRAAYGPAKADWLSRLNPDQDLELVVEYWSKHIETNFDNASGIITFDVEAFSAEDVKEIADRVLAHSKDMVNRLSEDARRDAVSYAEGEVGRAEKRLRNAFDQVRRFRAREQAIDPAALAKAQMQIIAGLEKQLTETQARIAVIEGSVDENSPALRSLRRQTEALRKQIGEESSETSKNARRGDTPALSELLANYETLEIERNFAQQAYTSALSSLEKAQVEANRQQRYLAVYSSPALPESALYPSRWRNIFLILIGSFMIWSIGTLITYSVLDHVS